MHRNASDMVKVSPKEVSTNCIGVSSFHNLQAYNIENTVMVLQICNGKIKQTYALCLTCPNKLSP